MNHAAAAHFEPAVTFSAERFRLFDLEFEGGFGEREEAGLGFDV